MGCFPSLFPSQCTWEPLFLYWGDIFIQENETLYRIGGFPRHREPYLERLSLDIAFDGEHLYYTDQFNRLVIHSLKTGEETLPGDVIASRFYLTPEGIFYLNIRDGNRLYQYDPTSGVSKKLSGQTGWRLADGGDDIWLYGDDALYRIAKDGTRETAVPMSQFPEGTILIPRYGNALFIVDSKETQIHQMDKRTLTWSILEAE